VPTETCVEDNPDNADVFVLEAAAEENEFRRAIGSAAGRW